MIAVVLGWNCLDSQVYAMVFLLLFVFFLHFVGVSLALAHTAGADSAVDVPRVL